jgi:hypothetical protein
MSNEKAEVLKKNRERSTAYPSIALEQATALLGELRQKLGKGPYSREEATKALGYTSATGSAARKVAALVHYGLLDRHGNSYVESGLAQDILYPLSEEQRQAALIKAVSSPKLFDTLIHRFKSQALPSLLKSILVRDGIGDTVAEEVAEIFKESVKYAGILQGGIITMSTTHTGSEHEVSKDGPEIVVEKGKAVAADTAIEVPVGSKLHTFSFLGGIVLRVPSTASVDEAILDGDLKEIRIGLKSFAEKHFGLAEQQSKDE